MTKKFKLVTEDTTRGVWLDERDLQDLIKVCYNRNNGLFVKLFADYEYLIDKKVKYSEIGIRTIKNE